MGVPAATDTHQAAAPSAASFRDPAGAVIVRDDGVLRIIGLHGIDDWHAFQASAVAQALLSSGDIVATRLLDGHATAPLLTDPSLAVIYERINGQCIVEHDRIPFPNYPYEWAPEMLHAAGLLTLEIVQKLARDKAGLKDATPYNVMFRGPKPVFIDVLSFEPRHPADPIWLAYAQFLRTFVLPLLAARELGMPLNQSLMMRRDGLEPEDLYKSLGARRCLKPPLFGTVLMPVLLSPRDAAADADQTIYKTKLLPDPEKAAFILASAYKRLRKALDRSRAKPRASQWSSYMTGNNNYSAEHFAAKEQFVQAALADFSPARVLDVGCNTGRFSEMAADAGASVVSIDYDAAVIGDVWSKAHASGRSILPLVVDLTRPTPGVGWRNAECSSFLSRARGRFDLVLMLAVVHHMLVTERVPLDEIVDLAAELTADLALIEFVGPGDSMFKRIVRGRERLHAGLSPATFEVACRRRFDVVRAQHLDGTDRWLYLLRKVTR